MDVKHSQGFRYFGSNVYEKNEVDLQNMKDMQIFRTSSRSYIIFAIIAIGDRYKGI